MPTVRNLRITSWKRVPSDEILEVAVPGLKLTGWWRGSAPQTNSIERLQHLWPDRSASFLFERDILEDSDGEKHQLCVYVRIFEYPKHWLQVVEESLKCFIHSGAVIAWAGGWECFLQYTKAELMLGCYAAYTRPTGLICSGDLADEISYIDEIPHAVDHLREAVQEEDRINSP